MSLWMFLKVFGDACLFFSVMAAFPGVFSHDFPALWPALLCGLGAALACWLTEQGKGKLRFFAAALPLASLILADGVMEYVMLAPVLLYAVVVIVRGMLGLEYYGFRESFRRSLTIWGLAFAVLWALSFMEGASSSDVRVLAWEEPLVLGLLYILSGVVLLRQLRLGAAEHNRTQLGYTLGGCAAAVMGIVAVEKVLSFSASSIKSLLMEVVTFIIGLPMRLYAWLISLLISGDMAVDPTEATTPTGAGSDPVSYGGMTKWIQEAAEQILPPPEEEVFPWWLVALVLVVITVAMIAMLFSFRKNVVMDYTPEEVAEAEPPQKEKPETRRSNRGKIRKYYRDYLKMEQKRGLLVKKHYTSQDVLNDVTAQTALDAASELRELYLIARYDEQMEITPEQVKQAKDALRRSKG